MTGEPGHAPIVVMGVAAAGKSTVGRALAARLGSAFVDADDLHSEASRSKMQSGTPLDDGDRWPWLDVVGAVLAEPRDAESVVVACSALRQRYRDRLRAHAPSTRFVHLDAAPEVLGERARARVGHFMPAALLASQLATLEPLAVGEPGCRVDVDASVDEIVAAALDGLAEIEIGSAIADAGESVGAGFAGGVRGDRPSTGGRNTIALDD